MLTCLPVSCATTIALRAIVAVLALTAAAVAQPCSSPCDIAGGPLTPWSSSPRIPRQGPMRGEGLVRCGKQFFFLASLGGAGEELWRTDGTVAGTRLVRDIAPGVEDARIGAMGCCGGKVYFSALDRHGWELWASDGTPAGTYLVKDIDPSPDGSSSPASFACLGGKVLFAAHRQSEGRELWISDGTAAGTTLVKDIVPGPNGSDPDLLVTHGNGRFVLFRVGRELWRSDGTAGGTLRVWTPGAADGLRQLAALGTKTLFAARSLWVTDGTPAGTRSLGVANPDLSNALLSRIGSGIYFSGFDARGGTELWVSDGTKAGTRLVADVLPGRRGSDPDQLTAVGSTLFFTAGNPATGRELYTLVSGRVRMVKDIVAGPASSTPRHLAPLDGSRVLFAADVPAKGNEPWISDGTAAGTIPLGDLHPGSTHGAPREFTMVRPGFALFVANSPNTGRELFRTDGTVSGTSLFADLFPGKGTPSSHAEPRQGLGDLVLLTANDGKTGTELWAHDLGGTCRLVKDIAPGGASSYPSEFVECWTGTREVLLIAANHPTYGREPWITDGTAAGTVLLKDIAPGAADSWPRHAENLGRYAAFSAWTPRFGRELWITDGTPSGTRLLKDIRPGSAGSFPRELTHNLGVLFFVADDGVHGSELWVSDGTSAGTRLVKDIRPGAAGSDPADVGWMVRPGRGGRITVFAADDGSHGYELWSSDGTPAGTRMLKDVRPGPRGSMAHAFVEFWDADRGVFVADDGSKGFELWVTDMTASGTRLLLDIRPGPRGSSIEGFEPDLSGRRLIFSADDGRHGREPWITDGTAAGTRMIVDLRPGPLGSELQDPLPFGPGWYFVADDGRNGRQLWFTDGRASGTRLVCRIGAGPAWGSPVELQGWRNELLMSAFATSSGWELHVLRNPGATLEWPGTLCPPYHAVLISSPPRLGSTATLTSWRGPAGHTGFLMLGLPARRPVQLPFSPPCGSWMDLAGPLALLGTGRAPAFTSRLPIPAVPWFQGVTVSAQTLWLPVSGPFTVQGSITLDMTLGR